MDNRLKVDIVGSILGNCLIITDNETKKNVEIMVMQLQAIYKGSKDSGSLPHRGYEVNGDKITIYHDEDRDKHEVTFTINELSAVI